MKALTERGSRILTEEETQSKLHRARYKATVYIRPGFVFVLAEKMSLVGLVAIFIFAILSALLWSYGLEIFAKCVKFILLTIFKVIKLILFGRKQNPENAVAEEDKNKEKTS